MEIKQITKQYFKNEYDNHIEKVILALASLQIYTFGIASTIGIPCIIALGILIKEFGFKKAIGLTLFQLFTVFY